MEWFIDDDIEDDWLVGASYKVGQILTIWFSDPADMDRTAHAEIDVLGLDLKELQERSQSQIKTYGDLSQNGFFKLAKVFAYGG